MADDDADLAELNSLEDDTNQSDQPVSNQPVPLPVLPPDEQHIPLDDAIAMATPPGGPPVATIGMSPLPPQEEIAPQPVQEEPAPLPIPTLPAQITPPSLAELSPLATGYTGVAGPGYIAPRSSVQQPPPSVAQQVEPYQYLLNKGQGLNAHGLNPTFASRLTQAIQAAEAATGSKANLTDLYRSPQTQAQYYANYTGRPVSFGGVTYSPQGQGGLAAAPGRSQHQQGTAADISHGPVLDWLHKNASQFGLEFLKGSAYAKDPVHIQLAGGRGAASQLAYNTVNPGPGNITSSAQPLQSWAPLDTPPTDRGILNATPMWDDTVDPGMAKYPPNTPVDRRIMRPEDLPQPSSQPLAQARQSQFGAELQDPNVRRLLAASTQAEVGGQGPQAEQAYIESVMNRALSQRYTLSRAIQDPAYYPATTMRQLGHGYGPDTQGRINGMITNALQGSNISNFATGNESGRVRSGGAPIAFNPGTGERFVHELADRKWVASMGAVPSVNRPMRDVGSAPLAGRQYAMLDTGTMSDASPEMPEDDQTPYQTAGVHLIDNADEADPMPASAPASSPASLSQTLSSPNIETQNLQNYLQSLNQAALPTSPVNLQPAAVPMFAGMAPPFHSYTVTGADGNPQTINALDAMTDPTIGMTKGIAMSPEVLDKMRSGEIPTYEETLPQHFTDEELRSMTHQPDTQRPMTTAERATLLTMQLPGRMIGGMLGLPQEAIDASKLMTNPYAAGPVSSDTVPEDPLAAATTETAMNVAGARFPFAKEPFSLGAGGGGKFVYPRDPTTGQFLEGVPLRPRGPDGQFLPDEAFSAPSPEAAVKPNLSPVGELLAEREAQQAVPPPASEPPVSTLPPAPQLAPPANFREAGTNLRALGTNPRAVAARKAAEAAAAAKSPIDELNALSEPKASALPELRPPTAEERIAPAAEVPPAPPLKQRVTKRPPVATSTTAPVTPAASAGPVGSAGPGAPASIPVQIVPASAAPPVTPVTTAVPPRANPQPMPTSTPRVSQTPPNAPAIPQSAVPQPPIPDYPQTGLRPGDYGRMADDQNAVFTRYLRGAGGAPDEIERLGEILRLHSGPQASALADQAAKNGHMQTPHVDYHVDVSLPEIKKYADRNPEFDTYLHAHDMLDKVQAMQRARTASRKNPTPGPITLHGYDEADLMQYIHNADQTHPDFRRVHGYVKDIVERHDAWNQLVDLR